MRTALDGTYSGCVRAPVFDVIDRDPALPPLPNSAPGYGTLRGPGGDIPVEAVQIRGEIVALAASVSLTVTFRNRGPVPVEATYILPLPERAALSGMRIRTASRVVDAVLRERADARDAHAAALARGARSALLEQERDDVFTVQVGAIDPGERVEIVLRMHLYLDFAADVLLFRFPLVVGPRYVPGAALPGEQVGAGTARDSDEVPDASRVSPPLAPAGAGPVFDLMIELTVAHTFPFDQLGCSFPVEAVERPDGVALRVQPGTRADRDLVVRLRTEPRSMVGLSLVTAPLGTFALTILPPVDHTAHVPRDVVVVVDNSSSMTEWRLVAARRIAARIVDSLTDADRFAVVTIGGTVSTSGPLVAADEGNRFAAIDQLVSAPPGGDPLVLDGLRSAAGLLVERDRPRVLLVIGALRTAADDHVLADLAPRLTGVHVHTVGVGEVLNGSLLQRLSAVGRGGFVVAESADALGPALEHVHRLIGQPLLHNVSLRADGMQIAPETLAPMRSPDVFPGSAVVVSGRWRGSPTGSLTLTGTGPDGQTWQQTVRAKPVGDATVPALWARAHLADLEERYRTCPPERAPELERAIVELSLRSSVLTRLTAFVAVVDEPQQRSGPVERVVAYSERPVGWAEPDRGRSAYAREYARRVVPTEPAPQPDRSSTGARPIEPTQYGAPQYGALREPSAPTRSAPPPAISSPPPGGPPFDGSPHPSAPLPGGAPPPLPAQQPASPPPRGSKQPDAPAKSRRGVYAGLGVAIVAVGVAIGGVAVTAGNNRDDTVNADSAPAPATTLERSDATQSPSGPASEASPAELTVELAESGSGTDVTATVSGVPDGTQTRVVVVGRNGTRDVLGESTESNFEVNKRTSIGRTDIDSVIVEGLDGSRYAIVEF